MIIHYPRLSPLLSTILLTILILAAINLGNNIKHSNKKENSILANKNDDKTANIDVTFVPFQDFNNKESRNDIKEKNDVIQEVINNKNIENIDSNEKHIPQPSILEGDKLKKFLASAKGKSSDENDESDEILPIYNALPTIPDDLRKERAKFKILVGFSVSQEGVVSNVKLIRATPNPRINKLLIESLYNWRFKKTRKPFYKEIIINFIVE